jgi:hypothetical protein
MKVLVEKGNYSLQISVIIEQFMSSRDEKRIKNKQQENHKSTRQLIVKESGNTYAPT